ncbi:MAG: rod-binding protein [Nitrospirota bacterium]|nr:rod-binding protein [Nitrospirota bacterium]MDE3223846.1 rod-binding protein [Nitrospirota bacterium]MDE3241102.1 rod-binding protein [Nitrospirota bacterium]
MQIAPLPIAYDKDLTNLGGLQGVEGLPSELRQALAKSNRSEAEIKQAAKELDAYFISYLMKTMRETVPKKGLLPNKGGEQFYYFYDMEIGRLAAERGGLGFGAMVIEDMARQRPADSQKNLSSPGSVQPIQGSSR